MLASHHSGNTFKNYPAGELLHFGHDTGEFALVRHGLLEPVILFFGQRYRHGFGFNFPRPDVTAALLPGCALKNTALADQPQLGQLLRQLPVGRRKLNLMFHPAIEHRKRPAVNIVSIYTQGHFYA